MARPSIIATLVGDLQKERFAQVKYGYFFMALARLFDLCSIYDATLRGPERWINMIQTFHPNRSHWKEHFYKNADAFRRRSRNANLFIEKWTGKASFCLQLGTMFDGGWDKQPLPILIYTDYTHQITAKVPEAGRSPFRPSELRQWLQLEKQAFEHAAFTFTRSELVRASVIQDYGIPENRVAAVGGGVNLPDIPPLPERRGRNSLNILFIGKDFYRKGGDLVLEAFQQIKQEFPHTSLTMVTTYPAHNKTLPDKVQIITPSWDRDLIRRLYEKADIFLLPSRLETWGDVLLEAMAYGLPCVGVKGQAMEEIITHKQTGWLAEPQNPGSLVEGLTYFLRDDDKRVSAGILAHQAVEERYTWKAVVERIFNISHLYMQ